MAPSLIKMVSETEVEGEDQGSATGTLPAQPNTAPPTAPIEPDPRVVAAVTALNARLGAVEQAVVGVPKSIGVIRGLLLALGNRTMMSLAMLGCLGLAGYTAYAPTWQGMAITGMVILGVFAPLAYINSRGG